MELTGKCREDIQEVSNIYINPKVIDWFDSQRIYILPCMNGEIFSFDIKDYLTNNGILKTHIGGQYKSRFQAMSEAVKKANHIYNESKTT